MYGLQETLRSRTTGTHSRRCLSFSHGKEKAPFENLAQAMALQFVVLVCVRWCNLERVFGIFLFAAAQHPLQSWDERLFDDDLSLIVVGGCKTQQYRESVG